MYSEDRPRLVVVASPIHDKSELSFWARDQLNFGQHEYLG